MLLAKIAWRYLFSKKSIHIINILSWVSMLGMACGAVALVVVLSVFNGFEGLIKGLYKSFYPTLKITPAQGKTIQLHQIPVAKIKQIQGIEHLSYTLEENVYLRYDNKEFIATAKGVDADFEKINSVKTHLVDGVYSFYENDNLACVLGAGLAASLNIQTDQPYRMIGIYVPKPEVEAVITPDQAFNMQYAVPAGVFQIQQDFDDKYILCSISFLQELLSYDSETFSAIEIATREEHADEIKEKLKVVLGSNFTVQTRAEQNEMLYRIMKIERWAVQAILVFILVIISFNIVGALSMLVMEKQRDNSILKTLGLESNQVQKIYLWVGFYQAIIAAVLGILIGVLICVLQQQFGFVKLQGSGGTFIVDAYPVEVHVLDLIGTFFTIIIIALCAAWYPAYKAGTGAVEFKGE